MKHLSREQLLDVAEGTGAAEHAAHVATCDACRKQADTLREALRLAGADPVPEPSPLHWERMAARVGAAVRREVPPRPWWLTWGWRWAPAAAVAALVVTAGVGVSLGHGSRQGGPAAQGQMAAAVPRTVPFEEDESLPMLEDPSWILVSDLSAEVLFDDVVSSGIVPMAGGADRALLQLDDAERIELAKILRAELTGPASADPTGPGV